MDTLIASVNHPNIVTKYMPKNFVFTTGGDELNKIFFLVEKTMPAIPKKIQAKNQVKMV